MNPNQADIDFLSSIRNEKLSKVLAENNNSDRLRFEALVLNGFASMSNNATKGYIHHIRSQSNYNDRSQKFESHSIESYTTKVKSFEINVLNELTMNEIFAPEIKRAIDKLKHPAKTNYPESATLPAYTTSMPDYIEASEAIDIIVGLDLYSKTYAERILRPSSKLLQVETYKERHYVKKENFLNFLFEKSKFYKDMIRLIRQHDNDTTTRTKLIKELRKVTYLDWIED